MVIVTYLMKTYGKVHNIYIFIATNDDVNYTLTVCHVAHACKTNKENDRTAYRTFVSGLLTSFFGSYLQGNVGLLQYIAQVDKIPMTLGNFRTDLQCDFRTE